VITLRDNIAIQLVHSWDEVEIANLYRAGGWWKEESDPEELPRLIQGSFLFAVAVNIKTGRAVGMGRVISDGVSDGYIQDLVVLPEYRKTGIGTQIVSTLVKKCIELGISWIGLIAEPDTEKFYLPFGFHPMEGHTPLIFRSDT
jgi:GNAT superfamily N-acetyltransferase